MPAASVSISHLAKSFDRKGGQSFALFRDLSINIRSGTFVAVLGMSGCGKTTLLRQLAGLEPSTHGSINIEVPGGAAARVGLMMQGYPSLPWLTVYQNVQLAIEARSGNSAGRDKQSIVSKHLSLVGLTGWESAYPSQLSGGMLQRLALARTLAFEPDLMLLDEPLGSLDALTRRELQTLLRDIHRSEARTIVMVTHDVEESVAVADRIIVLGPPGAGVIYDSETSGESIDKERLISLLAATKLTFAAGTWQGYIPFAQSQVHNGSGSRIWMGLSDAERIDALRQGRADGAFLSIQALAAYASELAALNAMVIYTFSKPTNNTACEHILRASRSKLQVKTWAVPADGLELNLIRQLNPATSTTNIHAFPTRQDCLHAVADGMVDACIADLIYAKSILGWHKFRKCRAEPLPSNIWHDLWTVLVTTKELRATKQPQINAALYSLSATADELKSSRATNVHYFTMSESKSHLVDSSLDKLLRKWTRDSVGILPCGALALPDSPTAPR